MATVRSRAPCPHGRRERRSAAVGAEDLSILPLLERRILPDRLGAQIRGLRRGVGDGRAGHGGDDPR